MPDVREELNRLGAALEVDISEEEGRRLARFEELLREGGRESNLTSIVDHNEVLVKHFLDSLTCLKAGGFSPGAKVVDIGSGGGFPGIPLLIKRPDLRLTLIEANQRKAAFLRRALGELGLAGGTVIAERAEAVGRDPVHREAYDVATARAVGHLAVLAEECLPLVRTGGRLIAMKGGTCEAEVRESSKAVETMGGRIADRLGLTLPEPGGARVLVVIVKERPTPDRYPRRAGMPQKRPVGMRTKEKGPADQA